MDKVETMFADYAGFKKSPALRKKILRILEGKDDLEIMAWLDYMQKSETELKTLAEDLTNHETYFFRDIIQYEYLTERLLPKTIKRKQKNGDKVIRLWSAACSTGEEAYSLAITVSKYMADNGMAIIYDDGRVSMKGGWIIKVYGTDISRQVIAIAKNGIYSDAGLSSFRSFPVQHKKYFIKEKPRLEKLSDINSFSVHKSIRNMTSFDVHNLNKDALPLFLTDMDVIFCRNLMIYLDRDVQADIINKFAKSLSKGGYLVMSAVDKIHDNRLFTEERQGGNVAYQRR